MVMGLRTRMMSSLDNAAESNDLDGDGIGDNADTDRDGDDFANEEDLFPDDPAEWLDTDSDGRTMRIPMMTMTVSSMRRTTIRLLPTLRNRAYR